MTLVGDPHGSTAAWSRFASELTFAELPAALLPVLKALVLDTIGTALAASTLGDCCGAVGALVRASPGVEECTILGFGGRASAQQAALVNGALAHALNFDALGKRGGHLGLAAVPAPLAMAERRGAVSGAELLTAVALGAEFTSRLAASVKAAGVDTSARFLEGQLLGYFGAALAAGKVLGFPQERIHSVLGLALMQAAGTRQISVEGGAAKAIYGGFANHGAVLAVLLAEQGVDARCAVLEGPAGLFGLFFDGCFNRSVLTDGLGEQFYGAEVSFKRWPVSSVVEAYVAPLLRLRVQHGLRERDIERIQLRVPTKVRNWVEPAGERRRPANATTAANSIFFGIAKALCCTAGPRLVDVTSGGLADSSALALAEKIDYAFDDSAGAGKVTIQLRGGQQLSFGAEDAAEPVGFEALAAKFLDCARHAAKPVPESVAQDLVGRIGGLEQEPDVAAVLATLNSA